MRILSDKSWLKKKTLPFYITAALFVGPSGSGKSVVIMLTQYTFELYNVFKMDYFTGRNLNVRNSLVSLNAQARFDAENVVTIDAQEQNRAIIRSPPR